MVHLVAMQIFSRRSFLDTSYYLYLFAIVSFNPQFCFIILYLVGQGREEGICGGVGEDIASSNFVKQLRNMRRHSSNSRINEVFRVHVVEGGDKNWINAKHKIGQKHMNNGKKIRKLWTKFFLTLRFGDILCFYLQYILSLNNIILLIE